LIASMSESERSELVGSMQKIRQLLGNQSRNQEYKLRDPQPGDMGWIGHRQGLLYWNEYQWDWTFEALVCSIVASFVENFDPESERCWVAEMNGDIVGSVFIFRHDETTAKLRLLYVEAAARGMGLGAKLVDECINFSATKDISGSCFGQTPCWFLRGVSMKPQVLNSSKKNRTTVSAMTWSARHGHSIYEYRARCRTVYWHSNRSRGDECILPTLPCLLGILRTKE